MDEDDAMDKVVAMPPAPTLALRVEPQARLAPPGFDPYRWSAS